MTVPGVVLAGRYRLVQQVATGGMGSVWEAWDELLHRRVAIKELLPQPGLSKDEVATARSRVIREGRITARLHHRNAVTLYDVIDHRGQPCLVLQFVPSQTLNSVLAEQGLLPVPFVTAVGADVASALAAAHQVGIIHRDVKPGNILITPTGAAMITDFGISHAAGDVSLTSTGMVTGTPAFLAPEVARGAPSGFPADVFSLGATLYAALEGMPPFGRDQNAMAILHKVASGQIIPPRRSGALTSLLGQMLATDPAARPTMVAVAQLLDDLQIEPPTPVPALAPPPIIVHPPTAREWPDRQHSTGSVSAAGSHALASAASTPARRRRLGVMVTSTAVLLLVGLGAWLLVAGNRVPRPAADSTPALAPASASVVRSAVPAVTPGRSTAPTTSPPPTTTSTATTTSIPSAPSHPATRAAAPVPSTSSPPPKKTAAAPTTTRQPPTTSPTSTTVRTTPSSSPGAPPTSAQLAAAITDYYAVLPTDTDQGWARLTSNFQTGTAQNRQYYQRFWDSIGRVTATDAHGASPDTAEATITYYFKDGRTAVEPTVYSLLRQDGMLKIDSSTVLSSTTQ
ncbi:serine/threonine protein kinase [Nakamurella sp. UYEF19]|uniref:protein kinase domain-containing protein n=1 Tax=Nakamurella sp. UYEF19 TaxID=1756392 RepID=UPI00339AA1D9